jgi:hypothetical protein
MLQDNIGPHPIQRKRRVVTAMAALPITWFNMRRSRAQKPPKPSLVHGQHDNPDENEAACQNKIAAENNHPNSARSGHLSRAELGKRRHPPHLAVPDFWPLGCQGEPPQRLRAAGGKSRYLIGWASWRYLVNAIGWCGHASLFTFPKHTRKKRKSVMYITDNTPLNELTVKIGGRLT